MPELIINAFVHSQYPMGNFEAAVFFVSEKHSRFSGIYEYHDPDESMAALRNIIYRLFPKAVGEAIRLFTLSAEKKNEFAA